MGVRASKPETVGGASDAALRLARARNSSAVVQRAPRHQSGCALRCFPPMKDALSWAGTLISLPYHQTFASQALPVRRGFKLERSTRHPTSSHDLLPAWTVPHRMPRRWLAPPWPIARPHPQRAFRWTPSSSPSGRKTVRRHRIMNHLAVKLYLTRPVNLHPTLAAATASCLAAALIKQRQGNMTMSLKQFAPDPHNDAKPGAAAHMAAREQALEMVMRAPSATPDPHALPAYLAKQLGPRVRPVREAGGEGWGPRYGIALCYA